MDTSDNIIIEELKRIVKMQAQEIRLLKAKINYLEQELARVNRRTQQSKEFPD